MPEDDIDEIDISERELPKEGTHYGVISGWIKGSVSDKKKKEYPTRTLLIELEEKQSNGSPFTVQKTYKLDKKGFTKLREDVNKWSGKELSADQFKRFRGPATFLGQSCIVEVEIGKEGSKPVTRVAGFKPDPEKHVTLPPMSEADAAEIVIDETRPLRSAAEPAGVPTTP